MAKKDVKRTPAAPKVKAKAKPRAKLDKPRAKLEKPSAKRKTASKTSIIAMPPPRYAPDARVLDRLWGTVLARKDADPLQSHSARLLARGTAKIAQKFGEEAVECLIEAVGGHSTALISESADVLYHLLVLWVDAGLRPEQIWAELTRREAMSGIAEKAGRPAIASYASTKIP
jgi:phosphoribosyl-ATP pyrophosphohydrolase